MVSINLPNRRYKNIIVFLYHYCKALNIFPDDLKAKNEPNAEHAQLLLYYLLSTHFPDDNIPGSIIYKHMGLDLEVLQPYSTQDYPFEDLKATFLIFDEYNQRTFGTTYQQYTLDHKIPLPFLRLVLKETPT